MLTRLKVNGFKNLVDVDVRFGPFTCIAGPNAVGKSNLFDAIRFLSALASKPLLEAASIVRNDKIANGDVRSLFHRVGNTITDRMFFEVEMIVPKEAVDDLGQVGRAKANFLRYTLELRYRHDRPAMAAGGGPLEIVREELDHIHSKEASKHILFARNIRQWQASALQIGHRAGRFISTKGEGAGRVIVLHQDGGRGRGQSNPISQPRTVLSFANAAESPTVVCAKREMESWQMLQLEPAALREPDNINAPSHLEANGLHLPKTLYQLAHGEGMGNKASAIYAQIANRLTELVADVDGLDVDHDRVRDTLTLIVTDKDGTRHPARSLSDGTLRFLALTVMEFDSAARGVICLEEPENGIHPERIPAMLRLLQDIATDTGDEVNLENPLRQIIVNTHSPAVVLEVPDDSLLVAESVRHETPEVGQFKKVIFSFLPDTWRSKTTMNVRTLPKGKLLAYLNPVSMQDEAWNGFYARAGRRAAEKDPPPRRRRVADRDDLQPYLLRVAES